MCRYFIPALVACLVFLTLAQRAEAQPITSKAAITKAEPAGYQAAVASALLEFDQGNFAEAREYFSRAHRLFPNARTLRGLGMVEFELRNYVDAASYLEQALAAEPKRLEGRLREETSTLLARTNTYLGALRLHLEPAGSRVHVDGFPVEVNGTELLKLPVGDHVLEFRADNRVPERRAIKIEGEQVLDLSVKLAALEPHDVRASRDHQPLQTPHQPRLNAPSTNAGGYGRPLPRSPLEVPSPPCS